MINIIEDLRKLAKSSKYQILYSNADKFNINLFNNNSNYSAVQIIFLNYLQFYKSLYEDVAMQDVNKKVLKSFIREDAYMYYKDNKEIEEQRKQRNTSISDSKSEKSFTSNFGFKFHKGKMKK